MRCCYSMMITPCDPLFVMLPVLERSKDKSIPVDNLLADPDLLREFPGYSRLGNVLKSAKLATICDINGNSQMYCSLVLQK